MLCSFSRRLPLKVRAVAAVDYDTVRPASPQPSLFQRFGIVQQAPPLQINYSTFVHEVDVGNVRTVEIAQDNSKLRAYMKYASDVPLEVVLPRDNTIVNTLLKHRVDVVVRTPQQQFDFQVAFTYAFEFILLSTIIRMIFFGMNAMQGGNPLRGMSETQARLDEEPKTGVTFEDVAGCDNAKQDLKETVDFLKNPDKYLALGAKMPKGVLLVGPPGTGKTKLARAVAGEAGVPFFSCSGSEFVEMFVGVGSARVRSLFKRAAEKSPCIIFIDEIDAIGKKRGNGAFGGGGHEEHDQTINQLLTQMDGFTPTSGVVVIAATNRPSILDEALLRPGRFDRQVVVDLPDLQGRRQILDIFVRNKPLSSDVNLDQLSKITVGFSGAELENLCNEACIYAARRSGKEVSSKDFDNALEKLTLGEERKSLVFDEEKRKIIAYHEAGHALMGLVLHDFDRLRKISIVPRGATGGATYFEPKEDTDLVSRQYIENQIMVTLGGRIAEEIVFDKESVTNGASGDFMMVTQIVRDMVLKYGFSENFAPMNHEETEGLVGELELEINDIVIKLYNAARDIMTEYMDLLHEIAHELLEKETLREDDIQKYMDRIG